ncbi:hypothetical protein FRB99_004522 [Tulasnella sp. 403]|nr:hypothetical protein FRB99_004522 [Tulasnella sp. 403]
MYKLFASLVFGSLLFGSSLVNAAAVAPRHSQGVTINSVRSSECTAVCPPTPNHAVISASSNEYSFSDDGSVAGTGTSYECLYSSNVPGGKPIAVDFSTQPVTSEADLDHLVATPGTANVAGDVVSLGVSCTDPVSFLKKRNNAASPQVSRSHYDPSQWKKNFIGRTKNE